MRRTFEVVLLYIFATASSNLLSAAIPGLSIAHGTGRERQTLEKNIGGFEPGGGLVETLFAVFKAATTTLNDISDVIFAFPTLLGNIGVPDPIIAFLMAPAGFVILYDGIHLMTGRLSR